MSRILTRVTHEEMVRSNMLLDSDTIPRLKELQDIQSEKYADFMQKYINGDSPYLMAPSKPVDFHDDVLLAPRPPTNWEKQRQRHTYYTRLQNGKWRSEAMRRSLAQVIILAQQLFDVPMVISSIITEDEWVNQACTNNMDIFVRVNREMTLCGHTILRRDNHPMVVLDAKKDWRFAKFPQVVNGLVRFYAGIPLVSKSHNIRKTDDWSQEGMDQEENFGIGTLCVMSPHPRTKFSWQDEQNLRYLADFVVSIIDYHLCDTHLHEHKQRNQIRADFVTLPAQVNMTTTSKFDDMDELTSRACHAIKQCFASTGQVQCSFEMNLVDAVSIQALHQKENREVMYVPVYQSFGNISGYLVVSGENQEQIFDRDDENFLITFANSMTTYLQEMLLVRANKAKTEFLDSMSHEIRTPVHGLTAMTDLLLENEKVTPEMVNLLTLMQSSGRAIHTVLTNIFAFRDLESNHINRGIVENVNLDNHLQEILDGHASVLKSHLELYFRNNLPLEISHLQVNVEMFRSICNRLIENATKFTDKGSITVTLGRAKLDDDENSSRTMHVELLVKDTGRGIGPEFIENGLFMPFCKEDSFTQGVGLGLSLCEKYAKVLDDGRVRLVTTDQVEGTIFSLQFHVQHDEADADSSIGYIDEHENWLRLREQLNPTIYLDDDRFTQNVSEIQSIYYRAFYELTSFPTTTGSPCSADIDALESCSANCSTEPFAIHLIETRPVEINIHNITHSVAEREAIRLAQRYKECGNGCVIIITNNYNMIKFASLTERFSNLYILCAPFGRTRVNTVLYRALLDEKGTRKERRLKEINRIKVQRELQASPDHIEPYRARDIFALVVDDNLINLNILSTFMKKRQVRHITAQDGEEAVNLFKQHGGKINLVFMDIQVN